MYSSSLIRVLIFRKYPRKQDNTWCSSSPQDWIERILWLLFLSDQMIYPHNYPPPNLPTYQPTLLPSPLLSSVFLTDEEVRWSAMQRSKLDFREWFLSDTSFSEILHGVNASSEREQDLHHSTANSENTRNSSIVTLQLHLFSEWGISQIVSMSKKLSNYELVSINSNISSTSLVNLYFLPTHYPTNPLYHSMAMSLTGSPLRTSLLTKSSTSADLQRW